MSDGADLAGLAVTFAVGLAFAGAAYLFSSNGKKPSTPNGGGGSSAPTPLQRGTVTLDDSDFGGTCGLSLEVRRDFSRYFSSGTPAVFIASPLRWPGGAGQRQQQQQQQQQQPPQPQQLQQPALTLRPFHSTVPNDDYVAASNDRTVENFRELLGQEIRRSCAAQLQQQAAAVGAAATTENGEEATGVGEELLTAFVRCVSINAGFKVAMEQLGCPVLLQPTFCLALGPWQCHVVAYAFVARGAGERPRGRPGAQFTDTVVRIRSPNLFAAAAAAAAAAAGANNAGGGDAGDAAGTGAMRFEYEIFAASHETAAAELRADLASTGGCLGLAQVVRGAGAAART